MKQYSAREAAKKLGIAWITMQKHVGKETFPVPPLQNVHGVKIRLWTNRDLDRARKVLAGIKRGRKRKG